MFGFSDIVPPRCVKGVRRPTSIQQDILVPGTTPGYYGHFAREPNTDSHVRMYQYQQKKIAFDQLKEEKEQKQAADNAFDIKYEKYAVKKRLQREIDDRVKQKWRAHEETVEARRKRLEELLCREERQYYYETIDNAQKGTDRKMEEMKQKADLLKAQREADRLEIVRQKRIEQYKNRCQELRPQLMKKNLIETKYTQLQQMRENEARREADRELDQMWHELTMKEIEAKKEREVQEMLDRKSREKGMLSIWDKQIKGKELLKLEVDRIAQEDRVEMEKLSEQLRREEIEALDAKRRKRDKAAEDILNQIEEQKRLKAQREKEENALDQAFSRLTQLEIERQKEAFKDATTQRKREVAMYKKYLTQLEEERKIEAEKLGELLEIHRKKIEAKQEEAKCKIIEAKRKLQEDVLAERAEQLRYKKQEAEQQLKYKEAENELLRMAYETNERLQAESDRMERQAIKNYRADLRKQIEYSNLLRQREREELERQLAEGLKEEEKYRNIVKEMLIGDIEIGTKHPFRRALEQSDCYCPTLSQ